MKAFVGIVLIFQMGFQAYAQTSAFDEAAVSVFPAVKIPVSDEDFNTRAQKLNSMAAKTLAAAAIRAEDKKKILSQDPAFIQQQVDKLKRLENGVGGRGGGQGVLTSQGWRLLDLMTPEQLQKIQPVSASRLRSFEKCEYGKTKVFERTLDEVNETYRLINRVKSWDAGWGDRLESMWGLIIIKALQTNYFPTDSMQNWKDSPTVAPEFQMPAAWFNMGLLIIFRPVYDEFSLTDRIALQLHEAIRQLVAFSAGSTRNKNVKVDVGQIEKIVRAIVNGDQATFRKMLLVDKLEPLRERMNQMTEVGAILADQQSAYGRMGDDYKEKFTQQVLGLAKDLKNDPYGDVLLKVYFSQNYKVEVFEKAFTALTLLFSKKPENEALKSAANYLTNALITQMEDQLKSSFAALDGGVDTLLSDSKLYCPLVEAATQVSPLGI